MAKKQNIEELGLKKTMVTIATLLVSEGIVLSDAVIKAMQPAEGSVSTGPREVTILKDIDGVQLGRQCSVTKLWFANESFNKGTTCVKLADAAKGKIYNESKKMEKEANSLLDEARELTEPMDKIAKFEEYDSALIAASEYRKTPVEITDDMTSGGVASIKELAANLNVEVVTEA